MTETEEEDMITHLFSCTFEPITVHRQQQKGQGGSCHQFFSKGASPQNSNRLLMHALDAFQNAPLLWLCLTLYCVGQIM